MKSLNDVLITLDVDWAPDFAIDFVADLLVDSGVCATWLVTHASNAVDRLAEHADLFELGIHPNFSAGSTHGATPEDVLAHCLALVPDATSVRAHSLVQSTPLLELLLTQTRVTAELSVFLPYAPSLAPVPYTFHDRTMYRLPFLWEDDYEFAQQSPRWVPEVDHRARPGLKIFNFHPIHVYLNSCERGSYDELKTRAPSMTEAPEELAASLVEDADGTRTFFTALVANLADTGGGLRVRDLVATLPVPSDAQR